MLSRPHSITLISRVGLIPLIYMISSQASSSTTPLVVPPPPTSPLEFMVTLPHGQLPSVQQVHGFAKSYLPKYLAQINDQGCHHQFYGSFGVYRSFIIMPSSFPSKHYTASSRAQPLLTSRPSYNGLTLYPYGVPNLPNLPNLWANTIFGKWTQNRPPRYAAFRFLAGPTVIAHTRLLWTSNVSYEWDTSYDYGRLYQTGIQIPLLNFLCDIDNDKTDVLFILSDALRDPARSWHPFQNSYLLDSQDQADTWHCSICGALNSDDEYHATCNLSSP
ncbi:hypothetical protein Ddye_005344 [Dipteronia dyeriana]|uniref:Uncharacterized protein n=1 Tax=Dipteronia dyeriana TaxID=168575 RepID=A0AAE0CPM1_9ROSI|nr:hypothetical protein Ddye_005344 [Dipteronia dyeriana]